MMILFLQIKIDEPCGLEDGKETDPGLPEV